MPTDPDAPGSSEPGGGPGAPTSGGEGSETGVVPLQPSPDGTGNAPGSGSEPGSMEPGMSGEQQPGQGTNGSAASGPGGSDPGDPSGSDPDGSGSATMPEGAPPPPPVTEPEVIGGCFNQLLRNGDFERGTEGWTETSPLRDLIVWRDQADLLPTGVTPQAGNYLAWIGGIPSGDFVMYRTRLTQQVAIPADAVSLTFSGYVWAAQPEPGLPMPDWAILEVPDPDPSGTYLWRVSYWEDTVTNGWVYFENTETDPSRFAGKTVTVQVHNTPNGNGKLSVWLDSLRLEARCPR